jgi:hypothetical protein
MPKAACQSTSSPEVDQVHCPVLPIMRRVAALRETAHKQMQVERYNQDLVDELFHTIRTLSDLASITRATSTQGALFQLAQIHDVIDTDILGNVGDDDHHLVTAAQKALRLLSSIGSVLSNAVGNEAAEQALDVWPLLDHDDDLRRVERAMA